MKTFHCTNSLIKAGKEYVKKADIITFDLFDTLLIRRIHDPDYLKHPVARYITQKALELGLEYTWEFIQSVRDAVESRQRIETSKKFKDHEASYPIFMKETLETIFGEYFSLDLLNDVTAYEMAVENSMLVPREIIVGWLKELHEAKKKIYIISDVYLPSKFLNGLLDHARLSEYVDVVYSSADTFLAKASGEAFRYIRDKYKLNVDKWVHIGDNPISDGIRPHEFGISSLVLDDYSEKQRKIIIKKQLNYSKGKNFWKGRVLQQLMLPLEAENKIRNDLYIEGYNFLGPILGLFIKKIAEFCLKYQIKKIFFLSREGYIFKKYWEKAFPLLYPLEKNIDIEYLYVSRIALAGASCAYQGLTKENANIVFLPSGNRDFRDLCRIFGLQIEKLQPYLNKHNLQPDTILSPLHEGYLPENTRNYHQLLCDALFQEEVRKLTKPTNDALQLYLEDVDFFEHDKVALVDIGWLGTIPRFFYESIKHKPKHPCCHNLLLGATRGIDYPISEKNKVYGLIYDKDKFDFAASSIKYSLDFFEEACKAPHPTLKSYQLDRSGYKLIFRETDDDLGREEIKQDKFFEPLQQGILDSASKFGAAMNLLNYSCSDLKPYVNYLLVTKMAFPTTNEINNLRNRHHLDDFHGTHKPSQSFIKGNREKLWDASLPSLRWKPFLRLKHFLYHLRERINE